MILCFFVNKPSICRDMKVNLLFQSLVFNNILPNILSFSHFVRIIHYVMNIGFVSVSDKCYFVACDGCFDNIWRMLMQVNCSGELIWIQFSILLFYLLWCNICRYIDLNTSDNDRKRLRYWYIYVCALVRTSETIIQRISASTNVDS